MKIIKLLFIAMLFPAHLLMAQECSNLGTMSKLGSRKSPGSETTGFVPTKFSISKTKTMQPAFYLKSA